MRRINHNDLAPWFLEDHAQLPEIFKQATSNKRQAASDKRQAASSPQLQRIHKTRKDIYENK